MSLQDLLDLSSTPGQPTPSTALSLHEFAYGEEEAAGGGVLKALEIIGRPQLALGEALGAFAHEEDPWEAAKRGIKGERKYGTPGQLIFPEDPKAGGLEAIARSGGSLGVDILTDPAWLIGAPLAGKAVGIAAKAASASKILKAKNIPMLRETARYIMPITTQLRKFGRSSGKKIANWWDASENISSQKTAAEVYELEQKVGQLGLGKNKAAFNAVREHIESGALRLGQAHPDAKIQNLSEYVGSLLTKKGIEIEEFRDPLGEGFKIIEPVLRNLRRDVLDRANQLKVTSKKWQQAAWDNMSGAPIPQGAPANVFELASVIKSKLGNVNVPTGLGSPSIFSKAFHSRDFQTIQDYFPRLATPDFLKSISTEAGFSRAAQDIAKMNGISVIEAQKILKRLAAPRRAGNIEYARTLNMPGYEKNLMEALPRYLEQVNNRVEYARNFGVTGKILDRLMEGAVTKKIVTKGIPGVSKGITTSDAELIKNTVLGIPLGPKGWERAAKAVMAYQVMTKMGPLSSLLNLSQNANTAIRDGGINFLGGVMRSMTKEGTRQGTIAYSGGIQESLLQMMGVTGKWAKRWLTGSLFTPAERLNRLVAANSGVVAAERLLRQSGGKLTKNLAMRGMTADDIPKVLANNWKLPTEIADRMGMLASNATQHITRLKDIPLAWQSPSMRMALQFKQFVYQQTRFLFKDVVKPGLQYFATNGKEGAVAPLLRAVAAFGLGGQVVSHFRDQAKDLLGYVLRMEYEPREAVPDDWALRVLEDSFNMGGLGVAGDLAQRAAQRDLKGWILGPTYGDATDILELMAGQTSRMYQEKGLDLAAIGRQALKQVPGLSPLTPKMGLKKNVEEKMSDLEMLLYGK